MQPLQLTAYEKLFMPWKRCSDVNILCAFMYHDPCTSHPASQQCWGSVSCCHFLWCQPWHSVTLLPPPDASQKCPDFCLSLVCFRCSLCLTPLCIFFFSYPRPISSSSFLRILNLLPLSICVCQWMRMGSATSTTCGSTPCRTCWDTSTPTPSPSSLGALLTSHYAPMYKCSEAPPQV